MKAHISRDQRMERIGELLSKGVSIMLADECKSSPERKKPDRVIDMTDMGDHSRSILLFIEKVGSASPREIEHRLDVGRRTVLRKLKELQIAGLLHKQGRTTSTKYELAEHVVLRH